MRYPAFVQPTQAITVKSRFMCIWIAQWRIQGGLLGLQPSPPPLENDKNMYDMNVMYKNQCSHPDKLLVNCPQNAGNSVSEY